VLFLPFLGAIADYSRAKKRLMAAFCSGGVVSTCLLFFVTGHRYLVGGLLLIVANFAFGVTIVLYDAFLNDITTEDRRDKVSSEGYAVGYLGGGLLLAANLGLVSASDRLALSRELAVRISLLSAGLWWGGFALITFARLRPRAATRVKPLDRSYLLAGYRDCRTPWAVESARAAASYTALSHRVFLAQELGLPANETFLMWLQGGCRPLPQLFGPLNRPAARVSPVK
jgi:UMF1 family MFS transporter